MKKLVTVIKWKAISETDRLRGCPIYRGFVDRHRGCPIYRGYVDRHKGYSIYRGHVGYAWRLSYIMRLCRIGMEGVQHIEVMYR